MIATIYGALATGRAPGGLHTLYLLHAYFIHFDDYYPCDYSLLSVSLHQFHEALGGQGFLPVVVTTVPGK